MKKQTLAALMACAVTAAALMACSTAKTDVTTAETTMTATTTAAEAATADEAAAADETATADKAATADEAAAEAGTDKAGAKAPGGASDYTLRVGSMKGPTSMGLVSLIDQASKGEAEGNYEFTMVTAADELLAKVISGDLDVALVPANMASILYNKTNHGVNVIDINTLGVHYVVSSDDSIMSIADLKGKTVYMTGKGTTPDYIFQHILSKNGLTTDDITIEYKSEAAEVAAVLKEQEGAIGLLPQPFVTVARAQNESLKIVLHLNKEWEAVQGSDGRSLVTGVTICRSELFADPAATEAIHVFLAEHKASAAFANEHVEETAELVAAAGIIAKAPIAAKAIPDCSITYVDGELMKSMLDGYLKVLFDLDPASIGGALPDDAFYYIP